MGQEGREGVGHRDDIPRDARVDAVKEKPNDAKKLREFLDAHRNKDGGYATKPGDPSSMSGVYYCVIVSKWLDDMEAVKK